MEWLLILSLGIVEVESPPPVKYTDRRECVAAAKRIAAENKWIYYIEVGPETFKAEPGVIRPNVRCEPADWSKRPTTK